MRDLLTLLTFCLLTSTYSSQVGWNPICENPVEIRDIATYRPSEVTVALGSSSPDLMSVSGNFYKTSRNLFILFFILFLILGFFFFEEYRTQSAVEGAGRVKRRLQKDLQFKTVKGLKAKIAEKDRELAAFTIVLEERNRMLANIKNRLNDIYVATDGAIKRKLRPISHTIDYSLNTQQDWLQFQKQLSLIYPGFVDQLQKGFPNLSINDLRLCSYLRMNLTNQEIAALLHINQSSVQKARYRLKKKLSLPSGQDLKGFIIQLS